MQLTPTAIFSSDNFIRWTIMWFLIFIFMPSLAFGQKPEDRFTEIRGKRQHILDVGTGTPAVVFVSGFGDRVSSWMTVQRKIAESTRTISYDRAGLGESQMLGANRSLDTIVHELNEILTLENVKPPYILVGHSYGGHIIRYFAHKHPANVVGLVLVDPTVEFMQEEFRRRKDPSDARRYDSLSEHWSDPNWSDGVRREAEFFKSNNNAIKNIPYNKDIPTTVISGMISAKPDLMFLEGINEMKIALHKQWVTDSPHIKHVLATKSGHYVQFDEPELVIQEVNRLLKVKR